MQKERTLSPKKIRQEIISAVEKPETPQTIKVIELLNEGTPVAIEVTRVLKEGLKSEKPIVIEGEIHMIEDYDVRRKYADTILEIIGEKKLPRLSFEEETFYLSEIQDKEREKIIHYTRIAVQKVMEEKC